jgi:UDP-3-O-[3-hydroxymyristoyl] glucosamine N-acyltransferase
MAAVAILGAGGHGRDIAAICQAGGDPVEFFDDYLDGFRATSKAFGQHLIGINDPNTRRLVALERPDHATHAVHPTADFPSLYLWNPGIVVGARTCIGPDVILGEHVHIGAGCTITRTTVGAFTTIGPGVNIAGDVKIGEGVLVGVGAVVSNLVTIGDGAVIGAGAVVVRDVAAGETVVTRALTAITDAHLGRVIHPNP